MKTLSLILGVMLVCQIGMAQDSALQNDLAGSIQYAAGQIKSLAEAIPEDKYDWAPGEGVRSVQSVLLHVVSASYFFGSKMGATIPQGINPQTMEESVKGKDNIIQALQKSMDFISSAVKGVSDQDLDTQVDLFGGNKFSERNVMLIALTHISEHKGQLIAYARMNGITPPWSE